MCTVKAATTIDLSREGSMSAFHNSRMLALDGSELPLSRFAGQVVLVVNVASQCGLTPQYEGLERLQQRFGARGFSVLGAPCNQFAGQEPGTEADIQAFCSARYGVTFPLTEKISVNGDQRHPVYRLLAGEGAEFPGDITWNFEKFLMGKDGRVLARFSPRTPPEDPALVQAIENALA
jgi:glutathione peroxidase